MNNLCRFALIALTVGLLSAVPVLADSTSSGSSADTFSFTNTLGDLGMSTDTFTSGSLSVSVSGFSAPGTSADLFAKNAGSNEMGLGLVSASTFNEVGGTGMLQLNLQNILASNPTSITLGIGSLQGSESYQIWGSNTAGSAGTLLASNQLSPTFNLSNLGQYQYITITSPNGSVLLDSLAVNAASGSTTSRAPEPGSAALLLVGLGLLGGVSMFAKKRLA